MGSPSTPTNTLTLGGVDKNGKPIDHTDSFDSESDKARKNLAAPEITDSLIRQARSRELSKILSGRGIKSTFAGPGNTGSLPSPFPAPKKSALGGF